MKKLYLIWLALCQLAARFRDPLFWNQHRCAYARLCRRAPTALDDRQLGNLLRWHAHQLEKATKHISRGPEHARGHYHFEQLKALIAEMEKRADHQNSELLSWAQAIDASYRQWRERPGDHRLIICHTHSAPSVPFSDFSRLLHQRRSIRMWTQEAVPEDVVQNLLESAVEAPSSCNRQGWFFTAVRQSPLKKYELATNNAAMLKNAPLIIYLSAFDDFYPERFAPALDLGGASEALLLAAETLGLSGCCMYQSESADQSDLRRKLNLPRQAYTYMAICLGYPAENPAKPVRMPMPHCQNILNQRIW